MTCYNPIIYIAPLKCKVKCYSYYALNFPMDKYIFMTLLKILGKHCETRGVLIDPETT